MLRNIQGLTGYKIQAKDGEIGRVDDFYFDDEDWTIRYLVADTGDWFPGKQVLISPSAFSGHPQWATKTFPVNLTRAQVSRSPDIDTERPVSRRHESELSMHYGWPIYWGGESSTNLIATAVLDEELEQFRGDTSLQSMNQVMGYRIHAENCQFGHLDDFIVDDQTWEVQYLVIDTRNYFPGKKVLISPHWVHAVDWANSELHVDLTQEQIKNAPPYDPGAPVNRQYEEVLYDFYGRPKYWKTR
jgi:hypothetical protein